MRQMQRLRKNHPVDSPRVIDDGPGLFGRLRRQIGDKHIATGRKGARAFIQNRRGSIGIGLQRLIAGGRECCWQTICER